MPAVSLRTSTPAAAACSPRLRSHAQTHLARLPHGQQCSGSSSSSRSNIGNTSTRAWSRCSPPHFPHRQQKQQHQGQHKRHVAARSAASSFTELPVPNAMWRAVAAMLYLIPTMDGVSMGFYKVYGNVPDLLHGIMFWVGPWMHAYLVNQFLPLMIFFFVFLVVVRNKKLHHFVRFNAMQAMMCDILVMLPIIIQRYLPGEVFYSVFGYFYQTVSFVTIMTSLLWFTVNTLCGIYAIIPWVSEACLMQVAAMEQNSGG